ncbi:MAG: biotin--[Bacteroidales bacterium]|nr:biotin--[acetyl-CoA-carboxylase] ligase [Bacteroidales bacterium]
MAKKHDIIWYDRLDSTNEEAKRHISDIDNLSVLSALEQTAGRGQRGNTWSSKAGENLLFSIVLKYSNDGTDAQLPSLDAKRQSAVSELTALALIEFLSRHQISAQIKWPNDIYSCDRKICGVLIENSLNGKSLSYSIIGIGLNVNQRNFDVNLPNPGSMALSSGPGSTYDIKECLEEFMSIFTDMLPDIFTDEGRKYIRERYLKNLWRKDRTAQFIDYTSLPSGHLDGPSNIKKDMSPDSGRRFTGIIRDISLSGNILIEDHESREIREFGFKEIGYIL